MNWTGGRLKRHSKANANHLLKAQKQYFAKARQRIQDGPSPTSPQAFSIFEARVPSHRQPDLHQTLQPSRHQLKPSHERHRLDLRLEPAELTVTAYPRSEGEPGEHSGQAPPGPAVSPHPLLTAIVDPLDRIKRKLLENSDWAGLAVVKPLSIAFTPAEEMERIGRRRKVTREERKRKKQAPGQQTLHHNLIRPFRNRQSESTEPAPDPTDLSIRIGSNIHQTLTTQPSVREVDRSSAPQSEAAESMLLDKFEPNNIDGLRLPNMNVEPPHQASHPQGERHTDSGDLMPLSQARHLNSFDHVLERSSSVVRQVVPSSTPFDGPPAPRQRPVRGSQNGPSSTSSVNDSHRSECCMPTSGDRTGPMAVSKGAANSNSIDRPLSAAVIRPEDSRNTKTEFTKTRPDANISLTYQPEQRLCAIHHGPPPKFTLDYQAALERDNCDQSHESIVQTPAGIEKTSNDIRGHGLHLPVPSPRHVLAANVSGIGTQVQRSYQPSSGTPGSDSGPRYAPTMRCLDPLNDSLDVHEATEELCGHHTTRVGHFERSETRPASWIGKFQLAKEEHQASMRQTRGHTERSRSSSDRLGDENEAWMKFVFPKDFGRIQTGFTFGLAAPHGEPSQLTSLSLLNYANHSSFSSTGSSNWASESAQPSAISAPTAANTTIFDPELTRDASANNSNIHSETDFLSRFSPMEGVMDERLEHISMHNNAAATNRSVLSLPHTRVGRARDAEQILYDPPRLVTSAKRRASDDFDEPAHCSSSKRMPPKRMRTPLRPLVQPMCNGSHHQPAYFQTSKHPQRTPLHHTESARPEYESSPSSESIKNSTGHREAIFPFANSPASSRSRLSNHSTIGSPTFQHMRDSPSTFASDNAPTKTPSAYNRQSLWHVSLNSRITVPEFHTDGKDNYNNNFVTKKRLHRLNQPHLKSSPPPLSLSSLRQSTAANTSSRYF